MTDWPVKTLGDLMTVQNGYAFDSQYFSPSGKIGLIRIRDLKGGVGTETHFVGPYDDEYVVTAGDYLIGMDGEFRCYEWRGDPALLNQRVCRLRDFGKSIDARFLFYGINKFLKEIEDVTGYTTVKHLSSKSILTIEMPVPPLEEQKRIVELLDVATARVVELTECYEQARTCAKNLFIKSLDVVMFKDEASYVESTLKHLTTKIGSGATPTGGKGSYKTAGVPLIRSMNIHDSEFDFKGLAYIDKEQAQRLDGVAVEDGDVLLNITGASLTRTCLVPSDLVPARVNQHVSILRVKPELINERYLQLFLVCARTKSLLWEIGGAAGATRQALTKKDLEELVIKYPLALEDQKAIVEEVDKLASGVSQFVGLIEAKLTAAKNLRQSILEAAFAGEL
jgi:type I restriction enzyme S subunit